MEQVPIRVYSWGTKPIPLARPHPKWVPNMGPLDSTQRTLCPVLIMFHRNLETYTWSPYDVA